ncbi:MAG: glycosyltransferase family 4 protein, partial [Enterobacteriaceae bacterium]|nr:glycosyltransferase family 4 protein [Enterobacteriaceae bacterium]
MKIIIFTSFYGSGYGLGYSAYKEINEFFKKGHDVTVVYINKIENIRQNKKIKLIHLPKINKPFFDIIDYYIKLKKFSVKNNLNNYDIIYIQSLEFGLLNFSKIKTPIFYFSRSTIRGISDCYGRYGVKVSLTKKIINAFLIVLEKRLLHYCNNVFVKSNLMAEELIKFYNIQAKKIRVIYSGVDDRDFKKISSKTNIDNIKKKYGVNSKDYILIYAGRIVPQKGLIYLIQSLKLFKKDINYRLLVVGRIFDSLYYESIKKYIKANNLDDKIQFIGHINQFNMFKVLNISSVVISPSLYEPFGMINIQAAVLDKVIITTKSVGSNEILKKYNK